MSEQILRNGFTTGTCAAAAAKAAAVQLMIHSSCAEIAVELPDQTEIVIEVVPVEYKANCFCRYKVQKDAGDDPDVTDQAWIYATVSFQKPEGGRWYSEYSQGEIYLTGGAGVGVVTKKGLQCPVGMPAINPVPRKMIFNAVSQVISLADQSRAVYIEISIPAGRELAEKTFNPRLGIVGGISVLGTSGIVVPMSEQALIETIRLDIRIRAAAGKRCIILTPGNYGERFLKEELNLSLEYSVKCSNFIHETVYILKAEGFENVLFTGHIGKLIKVAGGVKNTHSQYGDRRMEIFCQMLDKMEDVPERERLLLKRRIVSANTTEEVLGILNEKGLMEPVADIILAAIARVMEAWSDGKIKVEVVMFSNIYGILGTQRRRINLKETIWQEYCTESESDRETRI